MPDESYNIIKAVEGLQNIANVNPLGRRQQRKRRETAANQEQDRQPEEQPESTNESHTDNSNIDSDRHSIDYRA